MSYQRKTRDTWEVQGNYGCGWEGLTVEDTRKEARERLREYDSNELNWPHRIKLVRERIEQEASCESQEK